MNDKVPVNILLLILVKSKQDIYTIISIKNKIKIYNLNKVHKIFYKCIILKYLYFMGGKLEWGLNFMVAAIYVKFIFNKKN